LPQIEEGDMETQTLVIDELTKLVIGCCYRVHSSLGPGFLEVVYKRALLHEIRSQGLRADARAALSVYYDTFLVGKFYPDVIVENRLVLELKAVVTLHLAHEVQLVNYLNATGIDDGLLINFGSKCVELKRKFRVFRAQDDLFI
jgi:GxxExxY protein